jgi:hypothetical protein
MDITAWRGRTQTSLNVVGYVAICAWCSVAAISAFLQAQTPVPNQIAGLDVEFSAFSAHLPARGTIGYLDAHQDAGSEEAVRTRYVAQYALAPLVVVAHVGPEFVIVAKDTADPGGDPRLSGYAQVATVPGSHRLFRRLQP